jgi:hypothetical protein
MPPPNPSEIYGTGSPKEGEKSKVPHLWGGTKGGVEFGIIFKQPLRPLFIVSNSEFCLFCIFL